MTTYTASDLAGQVDCWYRAAAAMASGDPESAVAILSPPLPDCQVVPMLAASCTLGVELVVRELRRRLGAALDEPLQVLPEQPSDVEPTAVERVAGNMVVLCAAHAPGEVTRQIGTAVIGWMLPPGATPEVTAERCAWLLAQLLALLIGVAAGAP